MLRKLVVFLYLTGIVSAGHFHHGPQLLYYNEVNQSPISFSTPAPPREVSSAQQYYLIPLEAKVLQSLANLQQPAAQISQAKVTQLRTSSGVQSSVNNQGATYSINPAVVKTLSPVSGSENKVTVEAHQHVTAHPPTTTVVAKQPIPVPEQYHVQTISHPAVKYVSVPVENPQIVHSASQFSSNTVQETVTAYPPTANIVTSTLPQTVQYVHTVAQPPVHYVIAPVQHGVHSELVNTVSAVPVGKKVTIEAHQSATAHPPTVQIARRVPQKSVTIYPEPTAYVTSTEEPLPFHQVQTVVNRPVVKLVSAPVTRRVPSAIQVGSKSAYETVTAYPPSAAYITSTEVPLSVHDVKTVVDRPIFQYLSEVEPLSVKQPVAKNTVTVESHQSVTAHPPTSTVSPIFNSPSLQVSAPVTATLNTHKSASASNVQYSGSTDTTKPIPVPVFFAAEEPQESKYISVSKQTQTAPFILNQQVPFAIEQPIPVPVLYPKGEAYIRYNSDVSTPLVYTKSLVDKDHVSADLVATHINSGNNYARAVAYSPASAVSSVSFNGLGVSYGW